MWGGFVKPWPMREKPMCLLPLSYSNHFHKERLLVVEAVMIFGSGVAGLSVLTHTHTPPTVDFIMAGKTFTHSPIRDLVILLFISTHEPSSVCWSHARVFSWFFQLMQRAESRALLSTIYCAAVVLSRTVCFIVVSLCLGMEPFILTHKQLLVGLMHSKLRAVLPLSPMISYRESFHA